MQHKPGDVPVQLALVSTHVCVNVCMHVHHKGTTRTCLHTRPHTGTSSHVSVHMSVHMTTHAPRNRYSAQVRVLCPGTCANRSASATLPAATASPASVQGCILGFREKKVMLALSCRGPNVFRFSRRRACRYLFGHGAAHRRKDLVEAVLTY